VRHEAPTVFLGGGRITSALVAGLRLAEYRGSIVVYDRNPEKLRALRRESGVEVARDLKSAVEQPGMLIVAVRPADVVELLRAVAACGGVEGPRLVVSLAAGVPLRKLRAQLGTTVCWARAMPSPVCRIAQGLTALTFASCVTPPDRARVRRFFENVGAVLEIPESRFDAFTATFSSSHGYDALATLAEAAKSVGLDRKTALTAAAHAIGDGILYWRKSGQTLAELLKEAATPGGTAAATMNAMRAAGYEKAVAQGLKAGIQRARRNARF
jgi:pyrroline-5-carboxylate reductase